MDVKPCRVLLPALHDVFIGCVALEPLEPLGEVVGIHEAMQVLFQLLVGFVVITLHCCLLQRPVHPLNLAVGPRVVRLGEAVLDIVLAAGSGRSG